MHYRCSFDVLQTHCVNSGYAADLIEQKCKGITCAFKALLIHSERSADVSLVHC